MNIIEIANRRFNYLGGAWIAEDAKIGTGVTILPGAVIGRPPLSTNAQVRKVTDELPPIEVGNNCVIGANAVLYRGCRLGADTLVGDTACIREHVLIGDSCIVAMGVTINYNTRLGNRVKIMDNSHITGNSEIEDDVFISLQVGTANDNSMGREAAVGTPLHLRSRRGVIIRRFATIGLGALLLPGIEVGENAIVGAGSIVTSLVPPGSLVIGIPARIARMVRSDELRR